MRVAFDIDDTLWKVEGEVGTYHQVPDYDLIQVLRWFAANGDEVIVWSAGGMDYAKTIVRNLGLEGLVTVIPKGKVDGIGITFDDQEINIGAANVRVKREQREE